MRVDQCIPVEFYEDIHGFRGRMKIVMPMDSLLNMVSILEKIHAREQNGKSYSGKALRSCFLKGEIDVTVMFVFLIDPV